MLLFACSMFYCPTPLVSPVFSFKSEKLFWDTLYSAAFKQRSVEGYRNWLIVCPTAQITFHLRLTLLLPYSERTMLQLGKAYSSDRHFQNYHHVTCNHLQKPKTYWEIFSWFETCVRKSRKLENWTRWGRLSSSFREKTELRLRIRLKTRTISHKRKMFSARNISYFKKMFLL